MKGLRITIEDLDAGTTEIKELVNDWLILTHGDTEVAYVNAFRNGTVQLTLKRARKEAGDAPSVQDA